MHGAHPVKHWSTTQKVVTLSSGEAELGGIVKGVGEGIGLCSLGHDLLLDMKLEVHADIAAAADKVASDLRPDAGAQYDQVVDRPR